MLSLFIKYVNVLFERVSSAQFAHFANPKVCRQCVQSTVCDECLQWDDISAVSAVRVFLVYSYSEVNSLCCVSVCSLFHKATQLLFVANLWVLFCIIRFCSGEHVVNNMSPAEYTVC